MKPLVRCRALLLPLLIALAPSAGAAPLWDGDRQVYREAFTAAKAGDFAGAERLAGRAHDPVLRKVLRWLDLTRGAGARFPEIVEFLAANPDWPGQITLRQRAEEQSAGVPDQTAAEWFKHYPPTTPVGRLRQADLMMAGGHQQEALEIIREVWTKGEFSGFEEKTLLQRYHGILHGADHAKRLDRLVWDGQAEAARRMMPLVGADYRVLAEARLALQAMTPGLERLVARVPATLQRDPGLLFERMRWRRRKEHYEDAMEILQHAPPDLERPAAWAVERQFLARRALGNGDVSLAYRVTARHALSSGPAFAELEFFAGWVALRFLKEPEKAYNHFVRLYDEVKLPVSVARGAYWAARAAEEMKFHKLADAWYGTAAEHVTTYYGQLAAARLGTAAQARALAEPQPRPDEIAAFDKRELVQAARALAEIGATDYVRPFVMRLSDAARTPGEHALVARLAAKLERSDLAITAAKKASYAGVTLLAEGYPLTELPPGGGAERPLVLAMTRQESAFDREAVSRSGARGLMQLMPATANHVAKSLQLPFSATRLTTDTRYNVTLGRAYLEGLLGDFSGSYVLAIAAYNAGPARVRQWMHDFGDPRRPGVDVVDWIESIPFGETRNYVQRVLENLQVYRLRVGDHGLAFSLASDLKR